VLRQAWFDGAHHYPELAEGQHLGSCADQRRWMVKRLLIFFALLNSLPSLYYLTIPLLNQ